MQVPNIKAKVKLPVLLCQDEFKTIDDLARYRIITFVASSTGDGDPPENALSFMRLLNQQKKLTLDDESYRPLKNTRFSLIGLGDTNYTTYQGNPRRLKTLMTSLGATTFHPVLEVDEVLGIENQVETWLVPMWRSLFSTLNALIDEQALASSVAELSVEPPAPAEVQDSPPEAVKTTEAPKKKKIVFKPKSKTSGPSSSSSSSSPSSSSPALAAPAFRWSLEKIVADEEVQEEDRNEWIEKQLKKRSKLLEGLEYFPHDHLEHHGPDSARPQDFPISIQGSRWLTHENAIKQTLEITIGLPSSSSDSSSFDQSSESSRDIEKPYVPGDAIGIFSHNPLSLVLRFLRATGLSYDTEFKTLPGPSITVEPWISTSKGQTSSFFLGPLLEWRMNLTSVPSKALLRLLSEYASDHVDEKDRLAHLGSLKGKNEYAQEIEGENLSIIDVLEKFPGAAKRLGTPETGSSVEYKALGHLLSHLGPLKPRFYSFCSSPHQFQDQKTARVAFSLLEYTSTSKNRRYGLTTHFLQSVCHQKLGLVPRINQLDTTPSVFEEWETILKEKNVETFKDTKIWAFYRPSPHFQPPTDLTRPLLMVGPGTGVAPFVGFLHDRRWRMAQEPQDEKAVGESWLFFGCRNRDLDFLYNDELDQFVQDGTLSHLELAFSRESPDEVVYVQDKLRSQAEAVASLMLEKNGLIYVCGFVFSFSFSDHLF